MDYGGGGTCLLRLCQNRKSSVERFRKALCRGMLNRSPRPHRLHRPTDAKTIVTIIASTALEQQVYCAANQGTSPTVICMLRKGGRSWLAHLEFAQPARHHYANCLFFIVC